MAERYTVKELRAALKEAGYKLRIKTYSNFCSALVFDSDGVEVTGSKFFTPSQYEAWKTKHAKFIEISDKFDGKTWNDFLRVVI